MTCVLRSDHRLDLGRRPERLDAVLADRDRLGLRLAVVHRDDPAVGEDEIGGRRLGGPAALGARLDGQRRNGNGKAGEIDQVSFA